MPDLSDIEKIEEMLKELGETERGGKVPPDYPKLRSERPPAGTGKEEVEPLEGLEEGVIEEKPEVASADEFEVPLEIPGEEEEEEGEEILDLPEDFDLEKLSAEEAPPVGRAVKRPEEEVAAKPSEREKIPEGKPAEEEASEEEMIFEEELPGGGVAEEELVKEEKEVPPGEIPGEKVSPEAEKVEPPEIEIGEIGEIGEEEKLELELRELEALEKELEEGAEPGAGELLEEEKPAEVEIPSESAGEEPVSPVPPLGEETRPVEGEGPPEEEKQIGEEEIEIEGAEEVKEPEAEIPEEISGVTEGIEEELAVGEEEIPEPGLPEGVEEAPPPGIEEEMVEEETVGEEEKPTEEIGGEEEIELPGIEEIEQEAGEVPLEEGFEEEAVVEEAEERAKEATGERAPEEIDIELSEEDIVLIQTKIKELSPRVAAVVRDIIVNVTLPPDEIKQLIKLLLADAPEGEIVSFVEEATGRKIPPRKIPPEVVVPPKVGIVQVLKENLAPLMRVSVLALLVVMIIGAIFFIFAWKPIRAGRYYREGLEFIKAARYEDAEIYFKKATSIYEKVSQYDKFGWEYALSGNYSLAEQKLKTGILKDPELKNISLRVHLAKLYNVQKRFEEADKLYTEIIDRYPDKYEFIKLRGENLIDWGRIDREKLDQAYKLFDKAYSKNIKNSDPLFKLLYISLLKNDSENIRYQYELLNELYPDDVDPVVYTELAGYFIHKGNLEPVRGLLYKVVKEPPYYPPAFYVFSLYYRAINNKKEEERMLRYAIQLEMERELCYPWDSRDYEMISNAYNNLGELYSRMELPGKIAEAINFFKKAIDASPTNPKPYFNLAHVFFYREKNYDEALKYYLEAKNLGYVNEEVRYNLGTLYFFRGNYYRAYTYWAELSEEMPDNPYVGYALGTALLHLGRYEAALGEFIMLADVYDELVKGLGEIKPWRAYHKRVLLEASRVYNNLGVTYQKLFERTGNSEYQTRALTALYKGGELADIIGIGRGKIQYNINYILHPDILRNVAIDDEISQTYRFEVFG